MLKEFRTQRIIWDKANSRLFEPVQAVEGDERGRRLEVQIVNAGVVEDLGSSTLSLAWQSPDGHKGLDGFEVVDASQGIFELYYPTGMLANKGRLRASLVLYETNGKLESREFDIYVQKTVIDNDAVESSDSFTALTDAVVRINDFDAQLAQTNNRVTDVIAGLDGDREFYTVKELDEYMIVQGQEWNV